MADVPPSTHLIQLLEKQPSCLIRVGRDGMLLACNDAGLSLLGRTDLSQVLDRTFAEHLHSDHGAPWREFVRRVWAEGAGSLECELVAAEGARPVLMQGIALRNHPDGLDSLLVAVRDTSPIQRLEQSLEQDRELQGKLADAETKLETALQERQALATELDALRAAQERLDADHQQLSTQHQQLSADHQQVSAERQQLTAEREQLTAEHQRLTGEELRLAAALHASQNEREAERARAAARLQELEAVVAGSRGVAEQLAAADTRFQTLALEQQQLVAELDALRSDRQSLVAALQERQAEQDAERARAAEERRQLEAALHSGKNATEQQVAEAQLKLDVALQEQQRLTTLLDTSAQAQQQLDARLAEARAEQERLAHAVEERETERRRLAAAIEERDAERQRLAATIEERDAERQRLAGAIEERDAERQRLAAALEQRDAEHARTVEERQRLEATLHEGQSAVSAKLQETESRLEAALRERQELAAALDGVRTEQQQLKSALDERDADRQRLTAALDGARVEHQQLTSALQERESERDRAIAEQRQLQAAQQNGDAINRRLTEAEERLADALRAHEQLAKEAEEARAGRDLLSAQLEESRGEQGRLAASVEQRDADRQQERAAHDAESVRLREQIAQHDAKLAAKDREVSDRIAALESQLAAAAAERATQQRLLDEYRATGDQNASAAAQHRQELAELEARLTERVSEQTHLSALVDDLQHLRRQLEAERDAAAAGQTAAEAKLQHALADAQAASAEQQLRDRHTLDTLAAERIEAVANAERATGVVAELRRLVADHETARGHMERALAAARADAAAQQDLDRARLEETEARLAQAVGEQQRLSATSEYQAAERQKLEAEQATLRADLERRLAQDYERTMAARDRERTELIANLQADLALAVADQRRLQTLLTRAETEQHRLIAAHSADRAEADRSLGEALFKKNQIAKTLADQRVELDEWRETARGLETLAAAGRVAVHVSRELHEMVTTLNDRARFLLSLAALDATYRPEVELLRSEAMRAASLARQLISLDRDADAAAASGDATRALAPSSKPTQGEPL